MSLDEEGRDFMKLGGGQRLGLGVPLWGRCDGIAREGTRSKADFSCASVSVSSGPAPTQRRRQHLLSSANDSEGFLGVLNPTPPPPDTYTAV